MDPRKIHKLDQEIAALLESLPLFLYSLFSALVKEGFTEEQALILTMKEMEIVADIGSCLRQKEKEAENDEIK